MNLVYKNNGVAVTNSLVLAYMFDLEHDYIMSGIIKCINNIAYLSQQPHANTNSYFIGSYSEDNSENRTMYIITQKGFYLLVDECLLKRRFNRTKIIFAELFYQMEKYIKLQTAKTLPSNYLEALKSLVASEE